MGSKRKAKRRARKAAAAAAAEARRRAEEARKRAEAERKRREHEAYLARTTVRRGYRVDKSKAAGSRGSRGKGGGFAVPAGVSSTEGLTTKKKVLLGAL